MNSFGGFRGGFGDRERDHREVVKTRIGGSSSGRSIRPPPVAVPSPTLGPSVLAGKHPLKYTYNFWYMHRNPKQTSHLASKYGENLKMLASFSTLEEFWSVYSHLRRPSDLSAFSDYSVFKEGVKPVWEDERNINGGKWTLRLRKGVASRFWELLLLALIGEEFDVGNEVCGLVVNIRYQVDMISIWNANADKDAIKQRISDTVKKVLELPSGVVMEYKEHRAALSDLGS